MYNLQYLSLQLFRKKGRQFFIGGSTYNKVLQRSVRRLALLTTGSDGPAMCNCVWGTKKRSVSSLDVLLCYHYMPP